MSNATEFEGFEIYEAGKDEFLCPYEVADMSFPKEKCLSVEANGFALDWEGCLWLTTDSNTIYRIPKEGRYDIHFEGTGKNMRW